MIESSFCFLPGVCLRTERRFWREGVVTWEDFLNTQSLPRISGVRKSRFDEDIAQAGALRQTGHSLFCTDCPSTPSVQLYEWLRPRAIYLDIETNSFGEITIVGLYAYGVYIALIRGESLDWRRLAEELSHYELLVTFYGTSFDLPMLAAHFPNLALNQLHLDLCGVGRTLGYRGGLKAIERRVGIERLPELNGFTGHDAVRQWNRWRHRRDDEARRLLLT
jgi:uncharacterized protein